MNRTSIIRHLALCWVLAGALLGPMPARADLCTDAGLPSTVHATYLGFNGNTKGGNHYAISKDCTSSSATSCVYHVKSLGTSGFGTLPDAISQGNRYIVFDVGGTITLPTGLLVTVANLTIDGCSAQKPGITLQGAGLYIHGSSDPYPACPGGCDVHDIIVRNIRARNATNDGTSSDGFRVAYSAYNIVFDHVSADYSGDGNMDITEHSHDVTVSWSIFSNAKSTHNSLLAYQPSYLTMHHNIFMTSGDRNPFSAYDYNGAWPDACYCPANTTCDVQCLHPTANSSQAETTLDLWNNVIWDWGGGRGSILFFHSQNNAMNNYYYTPPPQTARSGYNQDSLVVCSSSVPDDFKGDCNYTKGINATSNPLYDAWAHVEGNFNPVWPTINEVGAGQVATSFPGQPPTDATACSAAKHVISQSPAGAGAVPLDAVDKANIAAITLPGC